MRYLGILLASTVLPSFALADTPAKRETIAERMAAVAAAPDAYEARFQLGRAQGQAGQHAEAIATYSELLQRFPADIQALTERGRTHAWMRSFDKAFEGLGAALQKAPRNVEAWQALAHAQRWAGLFEEALLSCREWTALVPESSTAQLAYATVLVELRDFNEARAALRHAASLGADAQKVAALLNRVTQARYARTWEFLASYAFLGSFDSVLLSHDARISARRHFDFGSLALEVIGVHRFDLFDEAIATDNYINLWSLAYLYMRAQVAIQANLLPRWEATLELFQGIGSSWELSVKARVLDTPHGVVPIAGASAGLFVGDFYLRADGFAVWQHDATGGGGGILIRWYFDTVDDFLELNGTAGLEWTPTPGDPSSHWTGTANLRSQYFFSDDWGLTGGLTGNVVPRAALGGHLGLLFRL